MENVVAQYHGNRLSGNKLLANNEGLCQSVRTRLHRIGQLHAKLMTISQQVVALNSEMTTLQSEEAQLRAQYELAYDLQEIERQMLASGEMMKVQSWQTYTLELSEPDTVEYHQGSDLAQQIMSFAKNLVSAVKEYF